MGSQVSPSSAPEPSPTSRRVPMGGVVIGLLVVASMTALWTALQANTSRDALIKLRETRAAFSILAGRYSQAFGGGIEAVGEEASSSRIQKPLGALEREIHGLSLPRWPAKRERYLAAQLAALQGIALFKQVRGNWMTYGGEMASARTALDNAIVGVEADVSEATRRLAETTETTAVRQWVAATEVPLEPVAAAEPEPTPEPTPVIDFRANTTRTVTKGKSIVQVSAIDMSENHVGSTFRFNGSGETVIDGLALISGRFTIQTEAGAPLELWGSQKGGAREGLIGSVKDRNGVLHWNASESTEYALHVSTTGPWTLSFSRG